MSQDRFRQPHKPCQNAYEWQAFLEFADAYFRNRGEERPLVVELGILDGYQRAYYETLWGAEYIGIDKPFDVKTTYTNEFLDRSIKMTK